MLYLAIPAHNEVATIGVLLWRLRTVLAEFPREYEVVVYDDASTDDTADVAEQYERAMPVAVLRGTTRLGYAGAVDALLRHVATRTRYPRRDAVLLLQADFTDPPVIVPEFARRFEGGADLVVGERLTVADAPTAVKRLFKYGRWAMRPFVKVEGVSDLTASMRLVRISALREAIRVAGDARLVSGDSWTANTDLLLRLAPHARRVESVPMEPTFGVRMRETRREAMADTISAFKWAWGARGRRAVVGSSPAEAGGDERRGPRQNGRRREEPELSVERIREKVRERDGSSGIDGEPQDVRRGRRRERPESADRAERAGRSERSTSERSTSDRPVSERSGTERPSGERSERAPRGERAERAARPDREARSADAPAGERTREPRDKSRTPRPEREPRGPEARAPRRREEPRSPFADPTLELDDPFAPPAARREARSIDDIMTGGATLSAATSSPDAQVPDSAADDARSADTEALAEAVRERPSPRSASRVEPTDDALDADASADTRRYENAEDADDADDADSESEGGDETELNAEGEPRKKRRRNRRSRRGRKKKLPNGEEGENGVAGESAGEASGNADEDGNGDTDTPVRFLPGDHIDGEPVASRRPRRAAETDEEGDDDSDGDDEDDVAGVESMSDGAPRPRRRGRRGRRGGARRSRGGKKGGADEAPAGESE